MQAVKSARTMLFRENWFVGAVLMIALTATAIVSLYVRSQVTARAQTVFEVASDQVENTIIETMNAYGQVLRGGVGLWQASGFVSREEWKTYIETLDLTDNYPGIQGIGYNAVANGKAELDALIARARQSEWPDYTVRPEGMREVYTPVLYLEPYGERNARAIGFDIYSESLRRAAVDRAISTGQPSLTAKITLVQEDENGGAATQQSGVLLILPVFAQEDDRDVIGLVVSVFRMGDLVEASLSVASEDIVLALYDSAVPEDDTVLYRDANWSEGQSQYTASKSFSLFGRDWTFVSQSTPRFEARTDQTSTLIAVAGGCLASFLITALAWAQARRNQMARQTASRLAVSQSRIETLMGEVNHRSKNLLSLVQAIARQTSSDDPKEFATNFSSRLSALSASQDLLVKSGWTAVSLDGLIQSQLAHFDGLIGDRIIIHGPYISIEAKAAQTVGMAIHELATNAGKYGALSNAAGRVDISWAVTGQGADETLSMSWAEFGSPASDTNAPEGFGTKVTNGLVKASLGADVIRHFGPDGLKWSMVCKTARLRDPVMESGT